MSVANPGKTKNKCCYAWITNCKVDFSNAPVVGATQLIQWLDVYRWQRLSCQTGMFMFF